MLTPPFDLSQCDETCSECVKHYNEKYGKTVEEWEIPCKGIPKDPLPDSLNHLPEAEKKKLRAAIDPIAWAEYNFGWEPRWYQKRMLKCTSTRKVSRCGRQLGKTEGLALTALFRAATNKNFGVLIITPMKSHVGVIFKRINEFLSRNIQLKNSVTRNVKGPNYEIGFTNGSVIMGFSSGVKSGGEADVARGQSVQLLIFDEADLLAKEDIDSALATIINFPEAIVWVSSTPKGKREKFYNYCVNDPSYSEFHYPSQVNPMWTEALEKQYRRELTEIGYQQEILAEFGQQVEGVYQRKFIEAAKIRYRYEDQKPQPGWIYCIGADWNDDKIGTRIHVWGYNTATGKFRVVQKETVSKRDWTQIAAIMKIEELNEYWQPAYIYVDAGFGAGQIEMMRLRSIQAAQDPEIPAGHPTTRIKDILRGYHFGSKISTIDPVSQEEIKKYAKTFMVECGVRHFEHQRIEISANDSEFDRQLSGYVVDRRTATGEPKYKAENEEAGDHDIDAMNLALVAFTLEFTALGKHQFSGKIGLFDKSLPDIINSTEDDDALFKVKQRPRMLSEERRAHAPHRGRSEFAVVPMHNEMPGRNLNQKSGLPLWSHPEFDRDGPAPTRKSRSDLLSRRGGNRGGGSGGRSNI